ncbi:MAG: GNAT family N-acetyltransferase [Chloroflexi bacterium]|nr:GNAT family N-acetyltransferase [Chloroflexota bacterium]
MSDNQFGLPLDLGDGLLLRWGTPSDAEELGQFNARIHADNPDEPAQFLAHWTHDLMNGEHPTTRADDFTVVVDENDGRKIVSSLNTISQTWTYDGIEFGVGRPELVGTDPAYRRRGLVWAQMEAVHAKSAARGELVQAITGIPWYYRQFGYEMTIDLGGSRQFFWARPGNDKPVEEEAYRMRPATLDDILILRELYAAHCADSLVTRVRDEALWRYELTKPHRESPYSRDMRLIEKNDGEIVAYVEYRIWDNSPSFSVRELGVKQGHSWRAVGLFLVRTLKKQAEEMNKNRAKLADHVSFNLGAGHPIYEALGNQLERQKMPYAWYVRVPDLPSFLRHIAPALEKRLANSVMAGHSGDLRLNFYQSQLKLAWKQGQLAEIAPYEMKRFFDYDAALPDLTFLQLLFGYRSAMELAAARADCDMENEATAVILLNILFPKRPSHILDLG